MQEAKTIIIKDRQLKCSFCGNTEFLETDLRLNTIATTFFSGVASLFAKKTKGYICSRCGKIEEFVRL